MFSFILITSQYWKYQKIGAAERIVIISSWDCRSANKSLLSL